MVQSKRSGTKIPPSNGHGLAGTPVGGPGVVGSGGLGVVGSVGVGVVPSGGCEQNDRIEIVERSICIHECLTECGHLALCGESQTPKS